MEDYVMEDSLEFITLQYCNINVKIFYKTFNVCNLNAISRANTKSEAK